MKKTVPLTGYWMKDAHSQKLGTRINGQSGTRFFAAIFLFFSLSEYRLILFRGPLLENKQVKSTKNKMHGEIHHRTEILNTSTEKTRRFYSILKCELHCVIRHMIWFIYLAQHTIVELATANKEQWNFLPRNWRNPVNRKQIFFVDRNGPYTHELGCVQNFALFGFYSWYPYPKNTGDILLVNLVTHKKFWLQMEKVHNDLRSGNLRTSRPYPRQDVTVN